MNKHYMIKTFLLAVLCFLLFSTSNANALSLNLVYPDNTYWNADTRQGGSLQITAENPRGNASAQLAGNASLGLYVTTTDNPNTYNNESLNDWAFYVRDSSCSMDYVWTDYSAESYSISTNSSWGLLSDINALSFDWFRQTPQNTNYLNYDPWNIQTPVLRLLIGDKTSDGSIAFSELVWEQWYTDNNPADMTYNTWVSEDLSGQNFWRHNFYEDTYSYYDNGIVDHEFTVAPYGANLSTWNSNYGSDAYVYGVSVGVGSMWPGVYTGYVDNVLVSLNGDKGIYDNFELGAPVPEPATLLLFGSGMGIMALGRRWRKKGSKV
jgi:hypothetical protein